MSASPQKPLSQRSDYTQKYNRDVERHGWLRLTPAYSVKIVDELLETLNRPMRIFDPFCGTGTTALSAASRGHDATTIDINPFLVWFTQTKTAHYSSDVIQAAYRTAALICELIDSADLVPTPPPELHNIQRWWSPASLTCLCRLSAAIDLATHQHSQERDLLLVAFCRTLIAVSNASFAHQSMSFKTGDQMSLIFENDFNDRYMDDVQYVLAGAAHNPKRSASVLLGDARFPPRHADSRFDCVITSPPYVNRMSYIRELRPYMYWLGFLTSGREAGELDWSSIGGTWGIATSLLNDWKPASDSFKNELLTDVLNKIATQNNKNGGLLANYIAKYFEDIFLHLQNLRDVLAVDAQLHYIVGNSSFYGNLLPVESIYAAMLESLGFRSVKARAIRKRNSKKELIEYEVAALWPGR